MNDDNVGLGLRTRKTVLLGSDLDTGESTAIKTAPVVGVRHDHHMIMRTIVPSLVADHVNNFSVEEVDTYIGSYLSAGWKLENVIMVQHDTTHPETGTSFAWFLTR